MNISFPSTNADQITVACGFKSKSEIDINVCVGAIDGMLIWILEPDKDDVDLYGFSPKKFFCGRQKKFGLNMQAVFDASYCFLGVEIRFPSSTSDYFRFE